MSSRKKPDPTPEDARACPAVHDVLSPRVGEPCVTVSLEDIERAARNLGCEVLFGPQKVKLVRTLYTYHPCSQAAPCVPRRAGPGMWECVTGDDLLTAAIDAWTRDITPNMIRALQPEDFESGPLKDRLVELDEYET